MHTASGSQSISMAWDSRCAYVVNGLRLNLLSRQFRDSCTCLYLKQGQHTAYSGWQVSCETTSLLWVASYGGGSAGGLETVNGTSSAALYTTARGNRNAQSTLCWTHPYASSLSPRPSTSTSSTLSPSCKISSVAQPRPSLSILYSSSTQMIPGSNYLISTLWMEDLSQ